MNLSDNKSTILLTLSSEPQRQAKAASGIASIEAGIAELSALGYRYACVEELTAHVPGTPDEYPKMLYRAGAYPTELTVEDETEEADARNDGWAGMGESPKSKAADQAPTPLIRTKADVKNVTQVPVPPPVTPPPAA